MNDTEMTLGLTLCNDEVLKIPASFYHHYYQHFTVAHNRKFGHHGEYLTVFLLYSDIVNNFLVNSLNPGHH